MQVVHSYYANYLTNVFVTGTRTDYASAVQIFPHNNQKTQIFFFFFFCLHRRQLEKELVYIREQLASVQKKFVMCDKFI